MKDKSHIIVPILVVVFLVIGFVIFGAINSRQHAAIERERNERLNREIDERLGIKTPTPSGKYDSIGEVYADVLTWLDRYESNTVSAADLRQALSDFRTETTAFDVSEAADLRIAMSNLNQATYRESDKVALYKAIDDVRRLKIE